MTVSSVELSKTQQWRQRRWVQGIRAFREQGLIRLTIAGYMDDHLTLRLSRTKPTMSMSMRQQGRVQDSLKRVGLGLTSGHRARGL